MRTDMDTKVGEFQLLARDGINHVTYSAYMDNNLWYHYLPPTVLQSDNVPLPVPIICSLTDGATHELWHHRLGHPGKTITEIIHEHVDGVPQLRPNQFYNCNSCMTGKFTKVHIGEATANN